MLVNEVRMLTALFENNNKAGKGRRSGSVSGSVADPDPGSGAFLTPGSWIPNSYF